MYELIRLIGPTIVGCISGVMGALLAARLRINEFEKQFEFRIKELAKQIEFKRLEEGEREAVTIRMTYIDPFRTCASDLLTRMSEISHLLTSENDSDRKHLRESYERIVTDNRDDERELAIWCNYGGHYAVSTIYLTALFFCQTQQDPVGVALHKNQVRLWGSLTQ